ncbi:S-adenosyl-L-methionine-dependent methyltransferase, partial [Entophlyctis helioformis]
VKEPRSPLCDHLTDAIKVIGPMSVAQYMRQALTHPMGGYYMRGDVFGSRISQMFGELLAVWFIHHWQTLAVSAPSGIASAQSQAAALPPFRLVELGPGRGTLMQDMLRTMGRLTSIAGNAVRSVHLVEAAAGAGCAIVADSRTSDDGVGVPMHTTTPAGVTVYWHDTLDDVPADSYTFMVAHEFFDALPVYKFEYTDKGWREIMVDMDTDPTTPHHFRFVRAPTHTKASITMTPSASPASPASTTQAPPTPPTPPTPVPGTLMSVTRSMAERIAATGGAALVIDYGVNDTVRDSLRGIRGHRFVHPLAAVGECDLSADVDFVAVAGAARDIAFPHGPVTQGAFLTRMGINARAMALLKNLGEHSDKDDERRNDIVSAYERLVSPLEMGTTYKFLAITDRPETPYAFEPDRMVDEALAAYAREQEAAIKRGERRG